MSLKNALQVASGLDKREVTFGNFQIIERISMEQSM